MKRHLIPRPTAPSSRGQEEPRAACDGAWDLLDAMLDHGKETRQHRTGRAELKRLCAVCPLWETCRERVA